MARKLTPRQFLLSVLALWNDLTHKEIGARAGMTQKRVYDHISRKRSTELDDEAYEPLLTAVSPRKAAASITAAYQEALAGLDRQDASEEELACIEEDVLHGASLLREYLTAALRRSRVVRPEEDYPHAFDLPVLRHEAEHQVAKLKRVPLRSRPSVVRLNERCHTWACVERFCEESVKEASRSLKRAASWARLACLVADRVAGPRDWRDRLRGYALAHQANILRVQGDLKAADQQLEEARRLWRIGSDPTGVFDPGRLLDLEGSLRRDQRRFEEALRLFDQAVAIGRFPERYLIKKGFTLEVMGDYEQAVEALLQAEPLVERRRDPRLLYMQRFNLGVIHCHLGRYDRAAELLRQVRELVLERGDRIEINRVTWLEGRILAGLGAPEEARRRLADARRGFAANNMSYDVALALLEEAGLLLKEGRTSEVKPLARELTGAFESQGVHHEARKALQLFQEAAEQESATAELARSILHYLFRARHDQSLRFKL